MHRVCEYCHLPLSSGVQAGRPRPDGTASAYCCNGCRCLGEANRIEDREKPAETAGIRLDPFTIRLGIGILIAGQSMIFGLAVNLEESTPPRVKLGLQLMILAGTALVIALLAPALFRAALSELAHGRLTIEALFLLTMSGAMFASMQSLITGRGPIYFEVVSVLLVVYSLGKAIGAKSRAAALASTQRWAETLRYCRRIDSAGDERLTDVSEVVPGNHIRVGPGETIAVDGVICDGMGFLSEAPATGEPFAVVRRPGDRVVAGTASYDADLLIEATTAGAARQIDTILRAVELARTRPGSIHVQADRLVRMFVPFLIFIACSTFAAWLAISGWQSAMFNSMSVLLVACPCALGLAAPIVTWSALAQLAQRGLVARDGGLVERLAAVDTVFFDKTGTLTDEHFAIVDVATFVEGDERTRLLSWLGLIERRSNHPLARPFDQYGCSLTKSEEPILHQLRVVPGEGLEATLEAHRVIHQARVGRPEWIAGSPEDQASLLVRIRAPGVSRRIDFAIDGRLAAIAMIAERLRDSAPETIRKLEQMGLPVHVLTGDTAQRASALRLAGIDGGLSPGDKQRRMLEERAAGKRPLMIGDGINDAAALAAAHVGIALAGGAELAGQAAAAALIHDDLSIIPWAIDLCRDASRAIRRNLWRAAAYNLAGVATAACGLLHPVVAALLMAASSLLTAWSSVRLGASTGRQSASPAEAHSCLPADSGAGQRWRAGVHAVACAAQGLVMTFLLLDLSSWTALTLCMAFAAFGVAIAWTWSSWAGMPHWVDMTIGMLTLGNLGMLAGWWIDNDFTPLAGAGCCASAGRPADGLLMPWMTTGMLVFANAAMIFLPRRPHVEATGRKIAMFSGGNLGMAGGMLLGGWLAANLVLASPTTAALVDFAGMTGGMLAGMPLGTEAMRWLIGLGRRNRLLRDKQGSRPQPLLRPAGFVPTTDSE